MATEKKKFNKRVFAALIIAPCLVSIVLTIIGAIDDGFGYEWYMLFAGAVFGVGLVLVIYAVVCKNTPMNLVGSPLLAIGLPSVLARYAGIGALVAVLIGFLTLVFCLFLVFVTGMRVAPPADNEKPEYKNYEERKAEQKAKEAEETKPQEEIVFKRYDDKD